MVISHGQPLLLLLLVSLFFLPAALGLTTGFVTCNRTFDYPAVVNTVEISPDTITSSTNANITITGVTSIDILDETTVEFNLWSGLFEAKRSYPLCDIVACPVKPCPIVFTFSNVFTEEELTATAFLFFFSSLKYIRRRLYLVGIAIYGKNQSTFMPEIMCIEFSCDTDTSA
ncbi:unnamed protein product [Brassica oleracea var. botrytis]